jgi:hypothetical protein
MIAGVHWATNLQATGAVFTIIAVFSGIVAFMYRKLLQQLKGDIIEIKKSVNANGLDTDSAGDSSKRTEDKVDCLIEEVREIKKALSAHDMVLQLIVSGNQKNWNKS